MSAGVLCGLTPRTDQTCVKAGEQSERTAFKPPTPAKSRQKPCTDLQKSDFGRGSKIDFLGVQKSALFYRPKKVVYFQYIIQRRGV